MNKFFEGLIRTIIIVFICLMIIGSFALALANDLSIFKIIGFNIIAIWIGIFVCYFVWAMQFYNIHFGQTKAQREKIEREKEKRRNGYSFNIHDIEEERTLNPYQKETFGLPNGTVRGMIAFTLLFGAIALLIVSFDSNLFANQKTFFYDQFEFFKTAFLMMIAFYFGSRSLEYLRGKPHAPSAQSQSSSPVNPIEKVTEDAVDPQTPNSDIISAINDMQNVDVHVEGNITKIPMIKPIKDPMSH